ncbi:MAG: glycogen synthase GlgA, partial [Pseudomonadota bacterium]
IYVNSLKLFSALLMKILFVSSEVFPFAKTGGLADVAGTLPVNVKHGDNDIRVITPFYKNTNTDCVSKYPLLEHLEIKIGCSTYFCQVWEGSLKASVPVYLIKCDDFFKRDYLYGSPAEDYPDNAERFIFFSKAALELCTKLDFSPDIIHCNDWQTGLIPAFIQGMYRENVFFKNTATVFTIHNIAYQGNFDSKKFSLTGLPPNFFTMQGLEYWGKMSFLKSGLIYTDLLTTVSKTYSLEIQTPEFGYGMEGILADRKDDLYAVLNGADYDEWNPQHDTCIASHYSSKSLWRKKECKLDLLKEYNLPHDMIDKPLIGAISRLTDQKGFDLIAEIMEKLMDLDLGFVLLGTGDIKYQEFFIQLGRKHTKTAGIRIAYDNALAHKIEAGCDMLLMPSRYEPCGLTQLYSLKYGTVPIVRATGGLADTIHDYDNGTPGVANGFSFYEYSADMLLKTIDRALALYANKKLWKSLMTNCMLFDFSWNTSALEYLKLYTIAFAMRSKKSL